MSSGNFYLRHKQSGMFVHPEGGIVNRNEQPLVLHPGGYESRLLFRWNQGCLQHVESGYYVHPQGGHANRDDVLLVFHQAGPEPGRIGLRWDGQYLASTETNRLVHPQGGVGKQNGRLVFHNDRGGERLFFEEVPETFAIRHKQSGLFIHTSGGKVHKNDQRIYLHAGTDEPRLVFRWRQGCLQHVESGYYVHPLGGHANKDDLRLVFHQDFAPERIGLRWDGNYLESTETHRLVHPHGGTGLSGCCLVFHNDRGGERIFFEEVPHK
jgi:hypothetical protein